MTEKWITVAFGKGTKRRIPESALSRAQEAAEYLRQVAHRPGSHYTAEEADDMFTLRILKDDE